MTAAHPRPHDSNLPAAASPPLGEDLPSTEFPMRVIVDVTDGLDGVMRVATMLRARRYLVRNLAVDLHEGVAVSKVRATVLLTASDADLLLRRLRRISVVTSASTPDGSAT
ncbi:hypothetical protein GCM10029978_051480 [Actinoallomurus acanthiterrae]